MVDWMIVALLVVHLLLMKYQHDKQTQILHNNWGTKQTHAT